MSCLFLQSFYEVNSLRIYEWVYIKDLCVKDLIFQTSLFHLIRSNEKLIRVLLIGRVLNSLKNIVAHTKTFYETRRYFLQHV